MVYPNSMFKSNNPAVAKNLEILGGIDDAVVMWGGRDGWQIGFFEDTTTICMCITDEDFENGELPRDVRQEIRDNQEAILAELCLCGFTLVLGDEEETEDDAP